MCYYKRPLDEAMASLDAEELTYYDDFIASALGEGTPPEEIAKNCPGYTPRQFAAALNRCRNGEVPIPENNWKPKQRRRSRAIPERDNIVANMYRAGFNAKEITVAVGYSHPNTVFTTLRRLGVPTRRELRGRKRDDET